MDWWLDLVRGLIRIADLSHVSGSSYISGPLTVYDLRVDTFDPFELCCYTNKEGKLSLLSRNYRNNDSIERAKKELKGGHSIITVSLIGEAKHGSVKNKDFCMYQLFINKDEKRATVIFRNSDVLKKLLIDVYWLKNVLMKELGIENYQLDACFNSVTLRAPFLYIYLNAEYQTYIPADLQFIHGDEQVEAKDPTVIRDILSTNNVVVKAFLAWYNKPTPNYKSLERAGRRMKELEIYKHIEPFIKGVKQNESL